MLTYELCKKLKDAGFPQKYHWKSPGVLDFYHKDKSCDGGTIDDCRIEIPTLLELIEEFAKVDEPYGLFEPHLWKDKIGDSLWHVYMQSVCAKFCESTGETPEEAMANLYLEFNQKNK